MPTLVINLVTQTKKQIAWKEENKKTKDGKRRQKPTPHEWRPPSPEEFGKRVIHRKPYTWNNNGSWKIDSTPDSGLTPGDTAAAAAKAIKFPTTIDDNAGINDDCTAVTEITQDQA